MNIQNMMVMKGDFSSNSFISSNPSLVRFSQSMFGIVLWGEMTIPKHIVFLWVCEWSCEIPHFHHQYIWSGMCDCQTTHWFVHVGCWSWLFWQWLWKRYFIHIMIYHKYMCVDDLMRENCNVCDCDCFRLRIWKRLRWNWNKSVEMNKWEKVYYESFRNGLFEFMSCVWMRRLNVFCVFFLFVLPIEDEEDEWRILKGDCGVNESDFFSETMGRGCLDPTIYKMIWNQHSWNVWKMILNQIYQLMRRKWYLFVRNVKQNFHQYLQ